MHHEESGYVTYLEVTPNDCLNNNTLYRNKVLFWI